jgi:superfamily II DNA or RNA helicase
MQITSEFLALLEQGLRHLADASPDGVSIRNAVGFSARDLGFGLSLLQTTAAKWTPAQADAAWRIASTYRQTQLAHLNIPAYESQVEALRTLVAERGAKVAQAVTDLPGWGLKWGSARTIQTKLGPRIVTSATIPDDSPFWSVWRSKKDSLKAQGYGVSQYNGAWQVSRWEVPAAATAAPAPAPVEYALGPVNAVGLLPYQVPSVQRLVASLRTYGAALDASDVGTGKTYAALAACREMGLSPVVVAPKAVLPSWKRAAAHLGVTLTAVTNYELVRRGGTEWGTWEGEGKFARFVWASGVKALIFDEVHRCKGTKTDNAALLIGAKLQAIPTLALSATAASNPLELKALGFLLGLHKLKGFWQWAEDYGCYLNRWGGYAFSGGAHHLARLHAQIFPLRGSRVRVADLGDAFPETSIHTEVVAVSNAAAIDRAYAEVQKALEAVEDKKLIDSEHHLTKLLRARQVAELGKVPAFVEMSEDAVDQGLSVAVFVNFDDSLKAIAEQVAKATGQTVVVIHGQQTAEERQAAIDAFQGDTARVLVANIRAGGVGVSLHDLHGKHARLALISPTWSAIDLRQTLGRVHRAGGKTKSTQKILFAGGTVEEQVAKLVEEKLANLDALNDGDLAAS